MPPVYNAPIPREYIYPFSFATLSTVCFSFAHSLAFISFSGKRISGITGAPVRRKTAGIPIYHGGGGSKKKNLSFSNTFWKPCAAGDDYDEFSVNDDPDQISSIRRCSCCADSERVSFALFSLLAAGSLALKTRWPLSLLTDNYWSFSLFLAVASSFALSLPLFLSLYRVGTGL